MKQIVIRTINNCSLAFLLDEGIYDLKKIVFNNTKDTSAKINQIYLGIIESKIDSLGLIIVKISNNENIIVKVKKNSFNKSSTNNIHLGQKLLVQIIREKSGANKMAVGSLDIVLSIGALKYQPSLNFNIISKHFEMLKNTIALDLSDKKGFIIRNFYRYYGGDILKQEIKYLEEKWLEINKIDKVGLIYEASFIEELLINNPEYINKEIIFENEKDYHFFQTLIKKYPSLNTKTNLYESNLSILESYNIEDYEEHVFTNKIAINNKLNVDIIKTDSFNYIDVNFKGNDDFSNNKEESLYHANSQALDYIEHYINLQELSGQILIDVLKIHNKQYRKILLEKMQKLLNKDNTNASVLGFSNLGLMEIAIKKNRENHTFKLKNDSNYQIMKIILEIQTQQRLNPLINVKVSAYNDIIKKIKTDFAKDIQAIENKLQKPIVFTVSNHNNIVLEIKE